MVIQQKWYKFAGDLRRACDILGSLGGSLHRQVALDGVLF